MSYSPQFEKEYENGWEDFPSEDTLITAHSLNMYDGTFENIEGYLEDHPIAQTTTMPTASASELGNVYQFVGETTATFTQGYFYKCVSDGEDPATYSWQNINVQSGGGGGTTVIANPTGTPTDDLETIQIGETIYDIPGGGGGTNAQWTQTQTNGTKIAEIEIDGVSQNVFDSTWSGTHAEYEQVASTLPNGTKVFFTDDGGGSYTSLLTTSPTAWVNSATEIALNEDLTDYSRITINGYLDTDSGGRRFSISCDLNALRLSNGFFSIGVIATTLLYVPITVNAWCRLEKLRLEFLDVSTASSISTTVYIKSILGYK